MAFWFPVLEFIVSGLEWVGGVVGSGTQYTSKHSSGYSPG